MGCSSLFTHVLPMLKSKVPCSLRITFFRYSSPVLLRSLLHFTTRN